MYFMNEQGEWVEILLAPSGDTLSIGTVAKWATKEAPTNWLLCNGANVPRTTYNELFKIIGTTYGTGDGTTTFGLPNLADANGMKYIIKAFQSIAVVGELTDDINTTNPRAVLSAMNTKEAIEKITKAELLEKVAIKETATGNPIQVNDSIEYEPLEYKLDGYTKQETTEGYNLLNLPKDLKTYNEFYDYSINIKAGNYTLGVDEITTDGTNAFSILFFKPGKSQEIIANKETKYYNITLDTDYTRMFFYPQTTTSNSVGKTTIYKGIRLYEGKGQKPWEPYSGGQPSPNPDYPQEIECLKSKNLFDGNYVKGFLRSDNGKWILEENATSIIIKCDKNTDYTISSNGDRLIVSESTNYPENNENTKLLNTKNVETIKVTTSSSAEYLIVYVNSTYNENIKSKIENNIIEVKSTGKNLFDKNNATILNAYFGANSLIEDLNNKTTYIKCKQNTSYTITKKLPSKRFVVAYSTKKPVIGTEIYGKVLGYDNSLITITTDKDAKYLVVWLMNGNIQGEILLEEALNTLQIEEGTKATPYEPYREQKVQIDLKSNELCKIGNAQDQVTITNKAMLDKKIGKYVFTGDENILYLETTFYYQIPNMKIRSLLLSNFYKGVPEYNANNNDSITANRGNGTFAWIIDKKYNGNVDQFKQWLKDKYNSGNPVVIYYELETPETKTVTTTGNLTMFNPNTILTTDKANQEVKYIVDTKTYIDNKLTPKQ